VYNLLQFTALIMYKVVFLKCLRYDHFLAMKVICSLVSSFILLLWSSTTQTKCARLNQTHKKVVL